MREAMAKSLLHMSSLLTPRSTSRPLKVEGGPGKEGTAAHTKSNISDEKRRYSRPPPSYLLTHIGCC